MAEGSTGFVLPLLAAPTAARDVVRAWWLLSRASAAQLGLGWVLVAVDGEPAAALLADDPLRADDAATVARLRSAGVDRVVLATGDAAAPAQQVAEAVGVDDGVDEAPALAAAATAVAAFGLLPPAPGPCCTRASTWPPSSTR